MTPELLQEICKERQMWSQPHLNTQLYLNYKGFLRIDGMEDYINVRSLHLDNNNISKIEGLDRMTELRSLHLGGNRISEIANLEANLDLRQLSLEGNAIRHVANLRHLSKLETVNLSANRIESLKDLSEIQELAALSNFDISHNSIEESEGVVDFWAECTSLKVLRYHGNPGVRHISHYRKLIINAMPQLTYMDERPVFPVERKSCKAWAEGGFEAMHEAKKAHARERQAACGVDPERRELVTRMRKMAIERLDREAKERKEKEEQQRQESDAKKAVCKDLGSGRNAESGDPEALEDYANSWKRKVNLYGEEGMRAKVSQEMGGKPRSVNPKSLETAAAQREHMPDIDFVPPSRRDVAPPQPELQTSATTSGQGRRQERPQLGVSDFCVRSSGEKQDLADRQFSVLDEGADIYNSSSSSTGKAATATGRRTAPDAAADATVMPLVWEQRQAATLAAEAECMEQQRRCLLEDAASGSASSPAAFRTNQLEGLD
jgi:dynein assembly factor 1